MLTSFLAVSFLVAQPVWHAQHEKVMNEQLVFSGAFARTDGAVLRVASSNPYRVKLNGEFLLYGPARAPKGFARVDEVTLAVATNAVNVLEITCAGYNCASYYFQNQPSYLTAEVAVGDRVFLATGPSAGESPCARFTARPSTRIRKVSRYCGQRMFGEAHDVPSSAVDALPLARQPATALLPRRVPMPSFEVVADFRPIEHGSATYDTAKKTRQVNFVTDMGVPRTMYSEEELTVNLWDAQQRFTLKPSSSRQYVLYKAPVNRTGFPMLTVTCREPGEVHFLFDELLIDGKLDPTRLITGNDICWRFTKPGTYEVEAFEPVTFKYAAVIAKGGSFEISAPRLRLYRNAVSRKARLRSSDKALEKIFAAAEESFAQNAVDVFTDCPSRERAGWNCDAYFTARASALLTGDLSWETLFLENHQKPSSFGTVAPGMLPMCWPADFADGNFIPSWAMFFVLQLDEYVRLRGGDRDLADALRPRIFALVEFLAKYRNSDGLLEKLPRWVLVEWSKANEFVQDVNYPNNMVYAAFLAAVDRLYGRSDLAREAAHVRAEIRRQSLVDGWFRDHAVRQKDGSLRVMDDCSETCQYYAFAFGAATAEEDAELYRRLIEEFGPDRMAQGRHSNVHPSNAFIGNFLRLDWLGRVGRHAQVVEELRGYFLYMAERTGTLWEKCDPSLSCNHGFTSYVANMIARDAVGLRRLDHAKRRLEFAPPKDAKGDYCELTIPTAEGLLTFGWRRENGKVMRVVRLPEGWTTDLATAFACPPKSARTQVWYHWVQDCVTREGLAADVQAMADAGISAAYVFTCKKRQSNLPSTAQTMSDEWLKLFDYFCEKAGQVGLEVGFHNCPGWTSSGGPWIRPENAMKQLCFYLDGTNTNECPHGFWRDIATYEVAGGHRLTAGYRVLPGACNAPASITGPECDKLSKKGLDAHWAAMPARILALPHAKDSVRYCVIDSNEQASQTWTEELPEHFRRLCGYDPLPFLPVLAGHSVQGAEADARFRKDFDRTIADMYAVNYYGHFAELCHANGIKAIVEPYNGPFDYVRVGMLADVPTAEFWMDPEKAPWVYSSAWVASSAARLAGRTCAAESFTAGTEDGRFQATPHQLRLAGDRAWSEGINQFVIHSYVHQPYMNVKPGVTLGNNGSMINRNMTWWPEFPAWGDYVARGQALLQSGKSVSDILVLTGNEGVNAHDCPPEDSDSGRLGIDVPVALADAGYSFDLCCANEFLVRDPSAYRAVWTPDPDKLVPELRQCIAAWKSQGVRVVHPPAVSRADDIIRALALEPAVAISGNHPLRLLRRVNEDGEVFYFYNHSKEAFSGRVALVGETWDAKTGERHAFNGDLTLEAGASCFVVTGCVVEVVHSEVPAVAKRHEPQTATFQPWTVLFDGPGGPAERIVYPRLQAWNESEDPRIRYFSGRARYTRRVTGMQKDARYRLSLGEVYDVANVYVGGRFVATRWERPYEVEFVAPGKDFDLIVEVVNTWPNRMIGDAVARQRGASEPRTKEGWPIWAARDESDSGTGIYTWSWTNFDFWHANDALLPSGLVGPVAISQL